MHMFFEEIIYNLLEESIHASYFFVEVVTALDEIQVEVFEEEHADDMIESDEQVHVNADTTDYNVLDSLVWYLQHNEECNHHLTQEAVIEIQVVGRLIGVWLVSHNHEHVEPKNDYDDQSLGNSP